MNCKSVALLQPTLVVIHFAQTPKSNELKKEPHSGDGPKKGLQGQFVSCGNTSTGKGGFGNSHSNFHKSLVSLQIHSCNEVEKNLKT